VFQTEADYSTLSPWVSMPVRPPVCPVALAAASAGFAVQRPGGGQHICHARFQECGKHALAVLCKSNGLRYNWHHKPTTETRARRVQRSRSIPVGTP
jgi:hypothetical protein